MFVRARGGGGGSYDNVYPRDHRWEFRTCSPLFLLFVSSVGFMNPWLRGFSPGHVGVQALESLMWSAFGSNRSRCTLRLLSIISVSQMWTSRLGQMYAVIFCKRSSHLPIGRPGSVYIKDGMILEKVMSFDLSYSGPFPTYARFPFSVFASETVRIEREVTVGLVFEPVPSGPGPTRCDPLDMFHCREVGLSKEGS